MDRQVLESDLQDLIEGRLDSDRVEAVRAALAADPRLSTLVKEMVRDRNDLIQSLRGLEQSAAADRIGGREMVAAAIARSERENLVAPMEHTISPARRSRRWIAVAASILIVAGVGLLVALSRQTETQKSQAAAKPMARMGLPPVTDRMPPPPLVDLPSLAKSNPIAPPAPLPETEAVPGDIPGWAAVPVTDSAELLEQWSKELESALGTGWRPWSDGLPTEDELEKALASFSRGISTQPSISDAAVLVAAGRARMVVELPESEALQRQVREAADSFQGRIMAPSVWPQTQARHLGSESAAAARPMREARTFDEPISVDLVVPPDPSRDTLEFALTELQRSMTAAGAKSVGFELVEEPRPSEAPFPSGEAVLPDLDLESILWWRLPPDVWPRGVTVRVELRPEGGNSGR